MSTSTGHRTASPTRSRAAAAAAGMGTPVNQGDVIMLADDTGKSFHSHLHLDVVMDTSGAVVTAATAGGPGSVGIPFVFRDVRGEGRPLNLTWA
mgnify:CR=1 FL=1